MEAIVTEWNTLSTNEARDLVNAAQVLLKGNQKEIRDLCHPWGVQLREKQRYRPMGTLKQELKMALTKRAKTLKSENKASDGFCSVAVPSASRNPHDAEAFTTSS